jgi:predicted RNA-binding protein
MSDRQYAKDYPEGHAESIDGIVEISELWIKRVSEIYSRKSIKNRAEFFSSVFCFLYISYCF